MNDAAAALAPLAEAMRADGYDLTVATRDPDIEVTVTAGPEACAECLVPKKVFGIMARQALEDQGIRVQGDLRIVYPEGHPEG